MDEWVRGVVDLDLGVEEEEAAAAVERRGLGGISSTEGRRWVSKWRDRNRVVGDPRITNDIRVLLSASLVVDSLRSSSEETSHHSCFHVRYRFETMKGDEVEAEKRSAVNCRLL